jgi:hypothetical protein
MIITLVFHEGVGADDFRRLQAIAQKDKNDCSHD